MVGQSWAVLFMTVELTRFACHYKTTCVITKSVLAQNWHVYWDVPYIAPASIVTYNIWHHNSCFSVKTNHVPALMIAVRKPQCVITILVLGNVEANTLLKNIRRKYAQFKWEEKNSTGGNGSGSCKIPTHTIITWLSYLEQTSIFLDVCLLE